VREQAIPYAFFIWVVVIVLLTFNLWGHWYDLFCLACLSGCGGSDSHSDRAPLWGMCKCNFPVGTCDRA
jgi:hypothetical protein